MRRSAKTDLRKASCMESPGWWGLQGGGGVGHFDGSTNRQSGLAIVRDRQKRNPKWAVESIFAYSM